MHCRETKRRRSKTKSPRGRTVRPRVTFVKAGPVQTYGAWRCLYSGTSTRFRFFRPVDRARAAVWAHRGWTVRVAEGDPHALPVVSNLGNIGGAFPVAAGPQRNSLFASWSSMRVGTAGTPVPHSRHSQPPRKAAPSGLDRSFRSSRASVPAQFQPRRDAKIGFTERRRSRTDRAWGYHTAQVLKSWRHRAPNARRTLVLSGVAVDAPQRLPQSGPF